jgi:hypothetical protein
MINSDQKHNLKEVFRNRLLRHTDLFNSAVSTKNGDWIVKGEKLLFLGCSNL